MSLCITCHFSVNLLTPNVNYCGRTAPLTSKVAFHIFIQQIQVLNILNMIYILRFFSSSKCSLFHNSNVFGSCFIHILYTGCAKIQKNNSGAKRLIQKYLSVSLRSISVVKRSWTGQQKNRSSNPNQCKQPNSYLSFLIRSGQKCTDNENVFFFCELRTRLVCIIQVRFFL